MMICLAVLTQNVRVIESRTGESKKSYTSYGMASFPVTLNDP